MRNNNKIFIAVFFLMIFCHTAFGQRVITISNSDEKINITSSAYLEDKKSELDITAVDEYWKQGRFIETISSRLNFGKTQSAYWFRISVQNNSDYNEFFLETPWPLYEQISLYTFDETGLLIQKDTGTAFAFKSRDVPSRKFVFKIQPPKNRTASYYFRIKTDTSMQTSFTVYRDYAFYQNDSKEKYLFGLLFGILGIMVLYNFIVFLVLKDSNYILYVIFQLFNLGFQFSFMGCGNELLWGNYPWIQVHSMPFFIGMGGGVFFIFSISFLQLKQQSRILYRVFIFFSLMFFMLSFATLYSVFFPLKIINFIGLINLILIILSIIVSIKNNIRAARFYAIGFSFYILGSMLEVFKNTGFLESTIYTAHAMQIGSALEVLLLSIALADKINIAQKEKELTQQKALEMQTRMSISFERFVPKEFLMFLNRENILDVKLGDQTLKKMCIMFLDIRSFTTLSEKMDPQENFNFLNSYLSRIAPIIRKNGGFIDKYIGDAVMALFSSSPENAIRSAIEIQNEIHRYNLQREEYGYDAINIGIGIHSGNLILGTIGEENRMDTTVISDSVNLASRLEGLTKIYNAEIIISGDIYLDLKIKNDFECRILDNVVVKGKNIPVNIYEIIFRDNEDSQKKVKHKHEFEMAFVKYIEKRFDEALAMFKHVLDSNPEDYAAFLLFKRCEDIINNNLLDSFDGAVRYDVK